MRFLERGISDEAYNKLKELTDRVNKPCADHLLHTLKEAYEMGYWQAWSEMQAISEAVGRKKDPSANEVPAE